MQFYGSGNQKELIGDFDGSIIARMFCFFKSVYVIVTDISVTKLWIRPI